MTNEKILEEVKVLLGLSGYTDIYGHECNADNSEIIPHLKNTLAQLKAENAVNLENYKKTYAELLWDFKIYRSRLKDLGGNLELNNPAVKF